MSDHSDTPISDRLRRAIIMSGLTGLELSRRAKVHNTTISRWINNRCGLSLRTADKLMKVAQDEIRRRRET